MRLLATTMGLFLLSSLNLGHAFAIGNATNVKTVSKKSSSSKAANGRTHAKSVNQNGRSSQQMASSKASEKPIKYYSVAKYLSSVTDYQEDKFLNSFQAPDQMAHETDEYVHLKVSPQELTVKNFNKIMGPNYQHPQSGSIYIIMRLPNQFRLRSEPQDSVSVSLTGGNTMVAPITLDKVDGSTRTQNMDMVGQTLSFDVSKAINKDQELRVSVRTFSILGSHNNNPILYPVSDRFIEDFHSLIGHKDPYSRQKKGYDQIVVDLRDTQGHQFEAHDEQTYVLPLVVDYSVFQDLINDSNNRVTLNTGVQAQIPVQKEFGLAGAGVYSNLTVNHKVARHWLLHYAVGVGLSLQKNIYDSFKYYDGDVDANLNLNLSAGVTYVDPDGKGRTSLLATVTQNDPFLNENEYVSNTSPYYVERQSRDSAFKADRRFGIAIVRETKDWVFQFQVQEDWIGGGNKMNGLNHEDFQVYVQVTRKFN